MLIDLNDKELVESLKYLLVSNEEKIQMETKSFDENRHCWIPDQKTVFIGATISEGQTNNESVAATTPSTTTGPYVTVVTDNLEVVTVKRTELLEMNSPEYEKCEDMANMTHLNDATIIHNLKERYLDYLIYVSENVYVD
jgi:myosin heavy subunit